MGSDTSDTAPASCLSFGTNYARIAYRSNPLYEHNHSAYSVSILFLFFLSHRVCGESGRSRAAGPYAGQLSRLPEPPTDPPKQATFAKIDMARNRTLRGVGAVDGEM